MAAPALTSCRPQHVTQPARHGTGPLAEAAVWKACYLNARSSNHWGTRLGVTGLSELTESSKVHNRGVCTLTGTHSKHKQSAACCSDWPAFKASGVSYPGVHGPPWSALRGASTFSTAGVNKGRRREGGFAKVGRSVVASEVETRSPSRAARVPRAKLKRDLTNPTSEDPASKGNGLPQASSLRGERVGQSPLEQRRRVDRKEEAGAPVGEPKAQRVRSTAGQGVSGAGGGREGGSGLPGNHRRGNSTANSPHESRQNGVDERFKSDGAAEGSDGKIGSAEYGVRRSDAEAGEDGSEIGLAKSRGVVERNPEVRERLQMLRSKYLKSAPAGRGDDLSGVRDQNGVSGQPGVSGQNGVSIQSGVTGQNRVSGGVAKGRGAVLLEVLRRNREEAARRDAVGGPGDGVPEGEMGENTAIVQARREQNRGNDWQDSIRRGADLGKARTDATNGRGDTAGESAERGARSEGLARKNVRTATPELGSLGGTETRVKARTSNQGAPNLSRWTQENGKAHVGFAGPDREWGASESRQSTPRKKEQGPRLGPMERGWEVSRPKSRGSADVRLTGASSARVKEEGDQERRARSREEGRPVAVTQPPSSVRDSRAVPGAKRADVTVTSASVTASPRDKVGSDVSTTSASGAAPRSRSIGGPGVTTGRAVGGGRGGGSLAKSVRASRGEGDVSMTSSAAGKSGDPVDDALEMARRMFGRVKGSEVGRGLGQPGTGLTKKSEGKTTTVDVDRRSVRGGKEGSVLRGRSVAAEEGANQVKQGSEGQDGKSGDWQRTEWRAGPRKGGVNAAAEEGRNYEDDSDEGLFAPEEEDEELDVDDGGEERELSAEELAEENAERAQFTAEELESGRELEYSGLPISLGAEAEEALAAQFGVEGLSGSEAGLGEGLDGVEEGLNGPGESSEGFAEDFRERDTEEGAEEWETDEESAGGADTESGTNEGDEQTGAPLGKRSKVLAMLEEVWGADDEGGEETGDKAVRFETRGPQKPAIRVRVLAEEENVSLESLTPLERARILFRGGKPTLGESRESPPGEEEDGAERAPARVTSPKWRQPSAEAERDPPRVLESSRRKVTTSSAQRKRLGQKVKKVEPLTTRAQVIERVKQLARDTLHEFLQMRLADRLRVDYIVNHCPKFLARQVLLPLAQSQNRSTPPEKQLRALVFGLSGTQLVTAYEEALEITDEQKGLAKRVLASHLHVHRYMEKGMAENIAENCPIFLVEGVIVPASTIPFEALSVVQRFHLKMRWRRKQRRPIPRSKNGDPVRDAELAMTYVLCNTKRKKLTWAFFEALGMPEADVIRARNKMRPGVSLTNLARVVTWLRTELELTSADLQAVIRQSPLLMAHSVESLEARKAFFLRKRIGVSEKTQREWLLKYPRMFTRPVESSLIPLVYGLIDEFGIGDAPELLRKYPRVFANNTWAQLQIKVGGLIDVGCTPADVSRLFAAADNGVSQDVLCNGLDRRIPPLAKLLRKNGLTEREVANVVVSEVPLLAVDLKEIERRLHFLLRDMERSPREIGAFPACLKYPVEARLQRLGYVSRYGFGEGLGLAELLNPDDREWQEMKKAWRGVGQHPASVPSKKNDADRAEELLAQWEEENEEDPEVKELVKMEEEGLVLMDPIKFRPRKRNRIPIPKVYNIYEQNRIRKPKDPDYTVKMLEKRLALALGEEPPTRGEENGSATEPGVVKKKKVVRVRGLVVKKRNQVKGKSPRKKKGKKAPKQPNTLFPGVEKMF